MGYLISLNFGFLLQYNVNFLTLRLKGVTNKIQNTKYKILYISQKVSVFVKVMLYFVFTFLQVWLGCSSNSEKFRRDPVQHKSFQKANETSQESFWLRDHQSIFSFNYKLVAIFQRFFSLSLTLS